LLLLGIVGTFAVFVMGNSNTAFNAMHHAASERDSFLSLTAYLYRDAQEAYTYEQRETGITFTREEGAVNYTNTQDSTFRSSENTVLGFATVLHDLNTTNPGVHFQLNTAGQERVITIHKVEDVVGRLSKAERNGN